MVGPSITQADRERFLRRLKIGFALLVGLSMALVTLWGGAGPLTALAVAVGTTLVGGLLAAFIFPDSIAETPYEDDRDRGPKPGERMQKRRQRTEDRSERATDGSERAADGDGRYRQ